MEIASAYQKMADDLNLTQQEIADKVGKDRASVANYIRLLKLPEEIQNLLAESKLSMGHARALLAVDNHETQIACAQKIVKREMSVRSVESMIHRLNHPPQEKRGSTLDPDLAALQEELLHLLGTKVAISGTANKGTIKIHYFSLEDLNRVYEKIKGENQ
jgi:ParB family chromosome partitioning protein